MKLELVNCDSQYWEFVRECRTTPKNQEGFFSVANITEQEQQEYMTHNWSKYKICLVDEEPAGYVGLLKGHEITYCVHPDFHGLGIGTYMIQNFSKSFSTVDAYVKINNIASQKVFEKLGWEKQIYYKWKNK